MPGLGSDEHGIPAREANQPTGVEGFHVHGTELPGLSRGNDAVTETAFLLIRTDIEPVPETRRMSFSFRAYSDAGAMRRTAPTLYRDTSP